MNAQPTQPNPATFDFTLDEIRAWGGERQYAEALEQYTNKGDVANPSFAGDVGEADITHAGHTIHTRFRTFPGKRRMVENLCPCASSQRDGRICVHMLAAAIALAQRARLSGPGSPAPASVAGRASVPRGLRGGGSGGPGVKFFVPPDWRARFAKGAVPLAISVSDGAPRPCSLRDVVERKVPCAPSQEEDDVLFALERLFPVAMPQAAAKTLVLPVRSFCAILERLGEGRVPLHLAGTDRTLEVKPPEISLPSGLRVALDEQTGRLVLSLRTDVPGAEPGAFPDYLVCRDAESWTNDRVWALQDDVLWPLKSVVPSTYADLYFKKEYALDRRETVDFIQREIRGDLPPIGNLRSLHDILGGEFESQVEFSVFTIRPGSPSFALVADGSKASISLSLKAVYSGLPAVPPAPVAAPAADGAAAPAPESDIVVDVVEANPVERFTIPDPKDNFIYYTRNREAEQAALRSLERRGLAREMPAPPSTLSPAAAAAAAAEGRLAEPAPQPLFLPNLVGEKAVLNFLATTVPTLRRDGWKVVLGDSLLAYRQSLPIVAPRVSIETVPETGAFRVSYVLETADGRVRLTDAEAASLPKPVRTGRGRAAAPPPPQDSFVMRDGSPILFDRTALESLKGILAECSHSRKQPKATPDDPLELSGGYAHFVKASLDALASSGVTIQRAPEEWLRAADVGRALRELKPAPLEEPLKSLLRPYQTVGVAWLRSLEAKGQAGILADEMGLGKTIQTLGWLTLPRVRGEKAPAIVVCPTSLVENWEHEARHFAPNLRVVVLSGAQRREAFDKIPGCDLAITSYALMRRDIEEYRQFRFSAVVLDEAQNIKNQNTQNARSVKQLDPSAARLVVTGTPIENSVSDLWSIMDFLMPGYLGPYETFKRSYEEPLLGDPGSEDYQDAARRIHDKLAPFLLRRLKRQVAKDLPPKVVQIGWCRLSDEQRQVYNRILDESRMQVTGSVRSVGFEKSRMLILTVLLRLRQVCCHLALLGKENPLPRAENPSGKLDHLMDLLDRAISGGHRTLVFSQFVEMLHVIRAELQKRKIPFCYLDGSSKDRMESVQRFNTDESIPVFLISLKAGGTGLNLTGADEVIHVDPWWNPAVEEQATDRAHRIGQKNTVHSVRLIATDTIEERVLQMQRRKRAIINSTVETGDEQTLSKLTWSDVQKLLDIE